MDLREVGDDYLVEEVFLVLFLKKAFFFFSSLKMIVQSMFFFIYLYTSGEVLEEVESSQRGQAKGSHQVCNILFN